MRKGLVIIVIIAVVVGVFVFLRNKTTTTDTQGVEKGEVQSTTDVFAHPTLGFSFIYPKDITVTNFPQDKGEVVLFRDVSKNIMVQIYITPFDEQNNLTPERIVKDLPNKKITNGKYVRIDTRQALAFDSHDEGMGDTWEVWMNQDGFLYQIMVKSQYRDTIESILTTWKF